MTKENQILIELLDDVENWAQLKLKLEKFNTSQTETTSKKTIAGNIFEVFCKYYFQADPKKTDLYSDVWLYKEIPLEISKKLNLPSIDHGIDLLLKDIDSNYYAVQCKFKNDETKSLSWSGDKIANVFALGTNCHKIIVFTNASDTTSVAKSFTEKFDQIAFDELDAIETDIFKSILQIAKGNQPLNLLKYHPKDHQKDAIKSVVEHFQNNNSRGQLILPCGAGKTLTALWIKEELKPKTTLVLVPSLALLKQIKNDWSRHKNNFYRYLCVCSERDIDKDQPDSVNVHTYEIGGPVTTNPENVRNFLNKEGDKVIYSTYQSIEVISEACHEIEGFTFDLIICDEAHRTAGSKNKNIFTLVHNNTKLPSAKRLYMTATPKVVSKKLRNKLGDDYDDLLCDMSNSEIFGEEAYRMTFGKAIELGILVDYRIVGIGVTDKQIKKFIEERNYIGEISVDTLAHNFALELVMNKYNAFHGISFHSKVQYAQDFANRHKEFFINMFSESVNGNQTTTYRSRVLRDFKLSEKGLVSNARCLTEGVDVPTIDLIYFCDPKTSKIDIVQASGRALRTDPTGKKQFGYIVVPLFHHIEDDIENEIKKKPIFEHLIQVIRSLCDQDERLQAEINDLSFKKNKKGNSKIQIDFSNEETERIVTLEGLEKKIRDVLFDEIIEKTRNYWDVRFNELKAYIIKNGNSTISKNNTEHKELYHWVGNLRKTYFLKTLDKEKINRLNIIGFDWKGENRRDINDLDSIWKKSYEKLTAYFHVHGDSDVPVRYSDKSLGTWCVSQRVKRNEYKLEKWQIELLDELKFNWKPKNRLEEFLQLLKKFIDENGHTKVVQSETKYGLLPQWVNRYRTIYNTGVKDKKGNIKAKQGSLPAVYIKELDALGFLWYAGYLDWNARFEELKGFYNKYGYSNVKQSEKASLYYWCYKQKKQRSNLTSEQIDKLNSLNFDFNLSDNEDQSLLAWSEKIDQLSDYYELNGNYQIPMDNKEYSKLIHWLKLQISREANNKITLDEISFFNEINFSLKNFSESVKDFERKSWASKIHELKEYYLANETFLITKHDLEQKDLLKWLRYQRVLKNKNKLSLNQLKDFENIGYSFDLKYSSISKISNDKLIIPKIDNWHEHYLELSNYKLINGNCDVPKNYENKTLYYWVSRQRYKNKIGIIEIFHFEQLNLLGFSWVVEKSIYTNKNWIEKYNHVKKIFIETGVSLITKSYKDQSLYAWVLKQRMQKRKGLMKIEEIKLLEEIKFEWDPESKGSEPDDEQWFNMLQQLQKYKDKFGDCNVSQLNVEYKKLGRWLNDQRVNNTRNKLLPHRKSLLNDIGVIWNTKDHEWNLKFEMLKMFYNKNGHFNVKQSDLEYSGLYNWLFKIKKTGLTADRKVKFESIGFNTKDININEIN